MLPDELLFFDRQEATVPVRDDAEPVVDALESSRQCRVPPQCRRAHS